MNTLITHIWMNGSNNFIISDDVDKHTTAVAEMVARGGRELESNVCGNALGEVVVQLDNKAVGPSDESTLREMGYLDLGVYGKHFAGRLKWLTELVMDGWQVVTFDQHNLHNFRVHLYHPDNERLQDEVHDS